MSTRKIIYRYLPHAFIFLALSTCLLVASYAYGAEGKYEPLVGIPELEKGGAASNSLAGYFNKLYLLAIGIGALIAFVKITLAGAKWSLSGIVTDKSEAKKDIQGALVGLLILLSPYIILNTIYDGFTNLNILQNASKASINLVKSSANTPTTDNPTAMTSAKNSCESASPAHRYILIEGKPADQFSSYYCAAPKSATKTFPYYAKKSPKIEEATADCKKLYKGVAKDEHFATGDGLISCSYLAPVK